MFGFSKPSQSTAPEAESAHLEPPSAASALGLHAGLSTALSFSFANSLPPAQDSYGAGASSRGPVDDRGGSDTPQETELQQQAIAHPLQALAAAAAPAAGHLPQPLPPGSQLHRGAAGAAKTTHQCSTEPWPVQKGAPAAAQEPASPAGVARVEQGSSPEEAPTCPSEAAEGGLDGEPADPAPAAAGQAVSSAQHSSAGESGPLEGSTLPWSQAAMPPQEPAGASSLAASAGAAAAAAAPHKSASQAASAPEAAGSMHQLLWPGTGVAEPDPQPAMQTLVAGQSEQEQAAGLTPAPQADRPRLAADAQPQAGAHSVCPLEPDRRGAGPAQQPLGLGQGAAEQPAVSQGQGAAGQRPGMESLAAGLFSLEWAFGFTPPPQQPAWQVDTAALASVPAQVARFEAWSLRQGPAGPPGSAALLSQPAGQLTGSPMGHPVTVEASRMQGESSAAPSDRQAAAVEEAGQAAAVVGGSLSRASPAAVNTAALQEVDGTATEGAGGSGGGSGEAEPSHLSTGEASTAAGEAADPAQLSRDGPSKVTGSSNVGLGSHQRWQTAELMPAGASSSAEPAAASAPQTAEGRLSDRAAASAADASSPAAAAGTGPKAVPPPLRGTDEHGTTAHGVKPHLRPAVGPAVEPEGHMQPQWTDQPEPPMAPQHHAVTAAAEQQTVNRQAAEEAHVGAEQELNGSKQQLPPPTATEPMPVQSGDAQQGPAGSGARTFPSTAQVLRVTEEGPWRHAAPRAWQYAPASSGQDHVPAAEEGARQQLSALPWQSDEQGLRVVAGERPRSALRLIDETLRDLDRAGVSGGAALLRCIERAGVRKAVQSQDPHQQERNTEGKTQNNEASKRA